MSLLRCSMCPYSVPLCRKDGKMTGYTTMAEHFQLHIEEHRIVQDGLIELDEDIRLAEEEARGTY